MRLCTPRVHVHVCTHLLTQVVATSPCKLWVAERRVVSTIKRHFAEKAAASKLELLEKVPMFGVLTDAHKQLLAGALELVSFCGSVLFRVLLCESGQGSTGLLRWCAVVAAAHVCRSALTAALPSSASEQGTAQHKQNAAARAASCSADRVTAALALCCHACSGELHCWAAGVVEQGCGQQPVLHHP